MTALKLLLIYLIIIRDTRLNYPQTSTPCMCVHRWLLPVLSSDDPALRVPQVAQLLEGSSESQGRWRQYHVRKAWLLLLQDFRVACDNAGVVANIREGSLGSYGHIVQEIRDRSNDFVFVEFVHEGRQSNVDAHNLARSCIYADLGRHVWFVSPHDGVCTSCE